MRSFNNGSKFGGSAPRKSFGGSSRDGGRRNFGSQDSNRSTMYPAVCAECGNNCKVPFMPSSGKPVYCSDCFEKRDPDAERSGRPNRPSFDRPARPSFSEKRNSAPQMNYNPDSDNKKFDIITVKLDKILKILSAMTQKENSSRQTAQTPTIVEVVEVLEDIPTELTLPVPKAKKPRAKKVVEVA